MVGAFLLIVTAWNLASLGIYALFARSFRVGIVVYAIGYGPVIARLGALSVRLIPLWAWFDPATRTRLRPIAGDSRLGIALRQGRLRYIEDVPRAASVGAVVLLPPLIALAGAALCLGGRVAPSAMISDAVAYVEGALSPLETGRSIIGAAFGEYASGSVSRFVGEALAVLAAYGLVWVIPSTVFVARIASRSPWMRRARVLFWLISHLVEAAWLVAYFAWLSQA